MARQITTDPQHLGCNPRRLLQMHQLRGILPDIRDIQVDIRVDIQVDTRDILRVLRDHIQTLRLLQGLMDILQ